MTLSQKESLIFTRLNPVYERLQGYIFLTVSQEVSLVFVQSIPDYCDRSVEVLNIKRGDIYFADLRPVVGSEQGGIRPVLIIQNDMGNKHSPTVICAAITSRMNKAKLPTHIALEVNRYDIIKDSVILLEQIRTIDKSRLREKVCHLDDEILERINHALCISLALEESCLR